MPGGRDLLPGGREVSPEGRELLPGGRELLPGGRELLPGGQTPQGHNQNTINREVFLLSYRCISSLCYHYGI